MTGDLKCESKRPEQVSLTDDEIALARKRLGREPNDTEWAIIDVMWSEHCSYKSSRPYLKLFPTEGKDVLLGVGDDCGIVDFDEKYGIAIGMESHNHPSAIEPVAGAATGVGGIVRDIISKGAKPIACLDPLRLGDIKNDTRSRYLFENIIKGIADYGNCIGVPTIGGQAEFDSSFNGNPLVNVVCIGLVEKDKIVRGIAPNAGDTMMLIGSKTGRDGIHGVTFASEELSEGSEEESRPAVQIEDPLSEKLLIDSFSEIFKTYAWSGCKDLGGGGFVCASSEIVDKGGMGALIHLDRLPLREKGMFPWEILLSETQERMMLIVKAGQEHEVERILDKWDVIYSPVGTVTNDGVYKVLWKGEEIVSLPTKVITEGPLMNRPTEKLPVTVPEKQKTGDPADYLINLLVSPDIASKHWISRQYDHEVQLRSVTKPGDDGTITRITPNEGAVLGLGCNSKHCALDIENGARESLAESLRNITAMGAKPLAVVDCLNFGNPEKPCAMWQFKRAVEEITKGLKLFGIPVVSGNVSFYNETAGKAINVSPIVCTLGKVALDKAIDISLKDAGDKILLIGKTLPELGACPKVDFSLEKKTNELVFKLISERKINACHDLSKGGLGVGLSRMAFAGDIGFFIDPEVMGEDIDLSEKLFSETNARYVIATKDAAAALALADEFEVYVQQIGSVGGEDLDFASFAIPLNGAKEKWEDALEEIMS